MTVLQTPDFRLSFKTLTKPKYSGIYGSLHKEICDFFDEYKEFNDVWNKSYMLFEHKEVRINKIRLENQLQNSGKSGGFRIIMMCDKRSSTVTLLYVYPKTGPHGLQSLNLDFQKKLVKAYSKAKADGTLIEYVFQKQST